MLYEPGETPVLTYDLIAEGFLESEAYKVLKIPTRMSWKKLDNFKVKLPARENEKRKGREKKEPKKSAMS